MPLVFVGDRAQRICDSEGHGQALAAGFNAHVSKPIEPAELLRTISRLLKKKAGTGPLRN